MKELEKNELLAIDGGKVAYVDPAKAEGNPIVYFGIALYNGAVSIRNFFGD